MLKVGVTGKSGFVGTHFFQQNESAYQLINLDLRKNDPAQLDLSGIDSIVHFAGLAHQMNGAPDQAYFDINVGLTEKLIKRAIEQGVKQFIYISSIKAYGDETETVLNEASACNPSDAYGKSKLQAESLVLSFASENFKVAVVRPPLIFGPGVKGNMLRLMQLAQKNIPLPFGRINNRRSMVFVYNLIALINTIIAQRASGIFLAADASPLSTETFVRKLQEAFHHRSKLFSLPGIGRTLIKRLKPAMYTRLFGSYVIDNSTTNRLLQFSPPYTTEQGIDEMVRWFKQHHPL